MMTQKDLLRSMLITLGEADEIVEISTRQVLRLKQRYLEDEERGIIHKNRGRKPSNALSDDLCNKIVELYQTKTYQGCNDHHFTELLAEHEQIVVSRSSVRNILRSRGIPSVQKRIVQYGQLVQTDASHHAWLEDWHEPFTIIGMIDDATSEVVSAVFSDRTNNYKTGAS